jgi:sec-independent protein translocase protein TatA
VPTEGRFGGPLVPFNIGPLQLVLILLILLVIFGAKRLPEIGRSLGSSAREFKDGIAGDGKAAEPTSDSAKAEVDTVEELGEGDSSPSDDADHAAEREKHETKT